MDSDLSEFEAEFHPPCGNTLVRGKYTFCCTAPADHRGPHTMSVGGNPYAIWPRNPNETENT